MDSLVNDSKNQSLYPTSSTSAEVTSCSSFAMKFNDATVIVSVIILGLINIIVIFGNILVIVSVFVSAKLRTVTNFFIVSLAVADLLVGLCVIPYGLTLEILDVWVFGEIWCQGWLVTDVWMCTASILNLCAISVDRYLAVTRPVRYRSIMTSKRAKIFIACVWVLSFIICFPPLVGWNDRTSSFLQSKSKSDLHAVTHPYTTHTTALSKQNEQTSGSLNLLNVSSVEVIESTRPMTSLGIPQTNHINNNNNNNINDNNNSYYKYYYNRSHNLENNENNAHYKCDYNRTQCSLFNNTGYVIYSALGSFYIPMFVMLFFYWRIYLVASRTSRALKRGYKTTKCNGSHDERLTLRIHRGYLVDEIQTCSHPTNTTTTATTMSSYLSTHCNDTNTLNTTTFTSASTSPKSRSAALKHNVIESQNSDQKQSTSKRKAANAQECKQTASGSSTASAGGKRQMPITLYRSSRLTANLSPNNIEQNGSRRMSPGSQSTLSLPSSSSPSSSREGSARSAKLAMTRFSKRTSKYQAKRFHAETKAAKTVGIIVGGFILCWLPFFTVYLARAFCDSKDCIPELLFSIFIWLGYCNSMINPCIYGLFSKDFRRAFRNIICRCKFREETVSSLIRQIHMPTFFEDMPEDMVKQESQED